MESGKIENLKGGNTEKHLTGFVLTAPTTEETPEEYISRFNKELTLYYVDHDDNIKSQPDFVKKVYFSRYTTHANNEFLQDQKSRKDFIEKIKALSVNDDVRQSKEKDHRTLEALASRIRNASRDFAKDDEDKKRDYYANTNQTRDFFEKGKKFDAYAYVDSMFNISTNFAKTPEGKAYIHEKIDNKNIFLFGGGDSIRDLLQSDEYKPSLVVNFDPYVGSETVDKNKNKIYRSELISAADEKIIAMVESGELPKADEVWASYSVPFYLDTPEEIKGLINNMVSVLNEGGTARITPIAVQSALTEKNSFKTREQALLDALREVADQVDFNISVFDDTLKIHKIKRDKQ